MKSHFEMRATFHCNLKDYQFPEQLKLFISNSNCHIWNVGMLCLINTHRKYVKLRGSWDTLIMPEGSPPEHVNVWNTPTWLAKGTWVTSSMFYIMQEEYPDELDAAQQYHVFFLVAMQKWIWKELQIHFKKISSLFLLSTYLYL